MSSLDCSHPTFILFMFSFSGSSLLSSCKVLSLCLVLQDDNLNNAMTERKFTRGLSRPGTAAQLRESVSQVVRETAVQVN